MATDGNSDISLQDPDENSFTSGVFRTVTWPHN